ncbi:MAG: 4,5-DOPA dioxygenase extradiol [Elusimicrobiales bacterium]|nr:4,5-DOPA dioxygenase extradiol [Elusimicrobiales bacterium]
MKKKLPVLFIGHGSPMNAALDNPFTRAMAALGESLPRPEAILCVSAHWLTEGELRLNGSAPFETIHDFHGFPDELYRITYAPPPALDKARAAAALLTPAPAIEGRGLDHGAWTVLRMLYPEADVPVFQLSVDYAAPGSFHYALGRRLSALRDQGVLIAGSGNIVHNLALMSPEQDGPPVQWNLDFDLKVKEYIDKGRRADLADYAALPGGRLAVPTPDHYWPFLAALGAGLEDKASYPYEGYHHATLSMRAVLFG